MLHPQRAYRVGHRSILFNATTTNYGYGTLNAFHNSDLPTTFLALIRPTGAGEGNFGYILAKTLASSATGLRFMVDHNAGAPRLVAGYSSGNTGPQRSAPAGSITYGKWTWVAFTFSTGLAAAGISILQGEKLVQEVTSYSAATDGTGSFSSDAGVNFHIGNRDGGDRTFAGDIAMVVRWNAVLESSEINRAIQTGPASYMRERQLLCWVAGVDIGPRALRTASVAGVAFGRANRYRVSSQRRHVWPFEPAGGGAQTITPSGIASLEAFGTTVLSVGAVSIAPSSITSAEVFGDAVVSAGNTTIIASGVASLEAFGAHTVTPGAVTVTVNGIATAEAFGAHVVSAGGSVILPSAISSLEAFGSHTLTPGAVTITCSGIATSEAFGATTVGVAGQSLLPSAIGSLEAFGSTTLSVGAVTIVCNGISSAEFFGGAAITGGAVTIYTPGATWAVREARMLTLRERRTLDLH